MLWNVSVIKGCAIAASDGRIGTISDFLFDDVNWQIHWLVIDTGDWLSGRKVLLTPAVMGQFNPKRREFSVELTMQQIENSPGADGRVACVAADGEQHLYKRRLDGALCPNL